MTQKSEEIIYLIDDDVSFSESMKDLLFAEGFLVKHFNNVSDFLASSIDELSIILCDMRMPVLTGLDLQEALKQKNIANPIIFISGESTLNQAVTSIKNGAFNFFTKPFDLDEVMQSIKDAFRKVKSEKLMIEDLKKISYRERQALKLFLKGQSNPDVAEELGIKLSTVKEYKANIFRKLEAEKISELMQRFRLLPLD